MNTAGQSPKQGLAQKEAHPPSLTLPLKGGGDWSESELNNELSSPAPLVGVGGEGGRLGSVYGRKFASISTKRFRIGRTFAAISGR